jgi:hypothetical protein
MATSGLEGPGFRAQKVRAAVSVTSGQARPWVREPGCLCDAGPGWRLQPPWLSREPAANTSSNETAPCAWRTWATRSASPRRSTGHARR